MKAGSAPSVSLPPPIFLGSHPALDFLNTRATPDGQVIDWIADGEAFLAWYRASPFAAAGSAILNAATETRRFDDVAAAARRFRERVRAELSDAAAAPGSAALRAELNRVLAMGEYHDQLVSTPPRVALVRHYRLTTKAQLLVPVAEAVAALLVDEDLQRVRVCEGAGCSLWFLDRTKSATRRYCSAVTCGNRAKVAAFRDRQRKTSSTER